MKLPWINWLGHIEGKVWVSVWSVAALVKFLGTQEIDPNRVYLFLGVLGLFTGHKMVSKIIAKKEGVKEEVENVGE